MARSLGMQCPLGWAYIHSGCDPAYGARPIKRLIEDQISRTIADELLFGHLTKGGTVKITLKDKKLRFSYPKKPKKKAR